MTQAIPSLRVAIFQYEARRETPSDRLGRLDQALAGLGAGTVDVLVCPELFLSGYRVNDEIIKYSEHSTGPFFQAVAKLAKTWKTAIIYGYPEATPQGRYNSALCVSADGEMLANHRKLGLSGDYEKVYFQAGNQFAMFEMKGYKLAIGICYDVEFPENIRACTQQGAEVVVVPTALVERWSFVARKMIPTRAFENGIFLLYANFAGEENGSRYLGESRIVAPDGEELAVAGAEEAIITAQLDRNRIIEARKAIPYLEDLRPVPSPWPSPSGRGRTGCGG